MDTFDLVCSFFNQYVFKLAKDNIDQIYSHFSRIPGGRKNNQLSFDFLEIIRTKNFEDIDYPTFLEVLYREGKTQGEADMIIGNIMKWKAYTKEQIVPTQKMIRNLIASTVLDKANELFSNQPEDYIQYIKNSELNLTDENYITQINFQDLDIDSIIAEDNQKQYVSSLDFYNYSFEPQHTVPGSQLIVVSGLPGTGKSLTLTAEALQYATNNGGRGGVHCAYFVLGDLEPKDFTVRLACLLTGKTFAEVGSNVKEAWRVVKDAVQDRLHLVFAPAGKVSADDIVEYAQRHPEIEVYFIDYDSLLAPPKEKGLSKSDSLYLSLGYSYDKLTEMTLGLHKLVYIASQPKSFGPNDNTESFGGSALGDSRRKFEIADSIITMGIADTSVPMGIVSIAKNRRGKKGRYFYVRPNARMMIIPRGVYDYLKNEYAGDPGTGSLTEARVLDYIRAYETQMRNINNTIATPGAPTGPVQAAPKRSPFD